MDCSRFSSAACALLLFSVLFCFTASLDSAIVGFPQSSASNCNLLKLLSCFPNTVGVSRAACCQAMDDILGGCLCTNSTGAAIPVQFEVLFQFASDCKIVIPVGVPCA